MKNLKFMLNLSIKSIFCIGILCAAFKSTSLTNSFTKAKDYVSEKARQAKENISSAANNAYDLAARAGSSLANKPAEFYQQWYKKQKAEIVERIKEKYPEPAFIRNSTSLSRAEINFDKKRTALTQQALAKLFGKTNLTSETPFKIAFVGTGGGYRAMVLTAGYMEALEKLGLLDAVHYCSTLSGSTWFLAPWIERQLSVSDYITTILRPKFISKETDLTTAYKKLTPSQITMFVNKTIDPKILFDQPISIVDAYGSLLLRGLFNDYGEKRYALTLPDQIKLVHNGMRPLPLYTAASIHKTDSLEAEYNWYEFSPFEITNIDISLAFPSFAWGWQFNNGKTVGYEPIAKLATLLGLFGSAFTVNLLDLERQNGLLASYKSEYEKSTGTQKIFNKLKLDALKSSIAIQKLSTLRASPIQIKNPFYQFNSSENSKIASWILNRKYLTFVDAGIDYNIPLKPVLRTERNVDFIIIGESSGNAETREELTKALADAKKSYGYNYLFSAAESNDTIHVYREPNNENAPVIVYFSFIPNSDLISKIKTAPELNAQAESIDYNNFAKNGCLKAYCNTFNFTYSGQDFDQLKTAGALAILAYQKELLELIKKEIEKKGESLEEGD